MKTQKQVLSAVKNKELDRSCCEVIDSRDYSRLIDFFPASDWHHFGFGLKEGQDEPEIKAWTEAKILSELEEDLKFAIEKARNQRGISSSLMYEVIKMWLWILDDELAEKAEYEAYGWPLYRAVQEKYAMVLPAGL